MNVKNSGDISQNRIAWAPVAELFMRKYRFFYLATEYLPWNLRECTPINSYIYTFIRHEDRLEYNKNPNKQTDRQLLGLTFEYRL